MRRNITLIVAVVALVAAACGGATGSAGPDARLAPVPESVQGLDARAALAQANAWGTSESGVTTFVDTHVVNFEFVDGGTVAIPLPADEMVVAVAPYVEQTHPCATHFMSGCQGELVGVPVRVVARDGDGTVVIDEEMETMANGFIEVWLPRDRELSLELSALGKRAAGTVTTYDGSNTCITTMQLGS